MTNNLSLDRFIQAQQKDFDIALQELQRGKKQSHWMWYIFPQLKVLGFSSTSQYYGIRYLDEATNYLQHEVLGERLIRICHLLLGLETSDAHQVFGSPDDLKLKSSMTLFAAVPNADPVFEMVLEKFFEGRKDERTMELIEIM
ncbi:MAG: DUF1810 domain-containing protein [Bacteroidota bacterium]